jgi:hypothetical protein
VSTNSCFTGSVNLPPQLSSIKTYLPLNDLYKKENQRFFNLTYYDIISFAPTVLAQVGIKR